MKVIFQILVILVVAALIGGMMYAAVNAGGAMTQTQTRSDFDGERLEREHEDREGGIMLPFGVVKSLIFMSVVGVPYFLWTKRSVQAGRVQK